MKEHFLCFRSNVAGGVRTMREVYHSGRSRPVEGRGYVAAPGWCRLIRVWVAGPAFGFEQFWFCWAWHQWGWPEWPGRIATAVHDWIDGRLKRWDRPMRWNAPDSGVPGEVGFWSPSEGTHERDATRVFVSNISSIGSGPPTITSGVINCTTTVKP
jgi:hypothetical protein